VRQDGQADRESEGHIKGGGAMICEPAWLLPEDGSPPRDYA
jgi:hypothetical protein